MQKNMKKRNLLFAIGLIIIGVIIIFSGGPSFHNQEQDQSVEGIGTNTGSEAEAVVEEEEQKFDKVPSFSLLDYDGNEVSNKDFEGKILVVNSWATWCPFCVNELPDFGELQEAFEDEIVVIAINRSESTTKAKNYSDDLNVTSKFIFLQDPKDSFYKSIGGFAMPETLFVDSDGNIIIHKRGPMDVDEMKEKIDSIINS